MLQAVVHIGGSSPVYEMARPYFGWYFGYCPLSPHLWIAMSDIVPVPFVWWGIIAYSFADKLCQRCRPFRIPFEKKKQKYVILNCHRHVPICFHGNGLSEGNWQLQILHSFIQLQSRDSVARSVFIWILLPVLSCSFLYFCVFSVWNLISVIIYLSF